MRIVTARCNNVSCPEVEEEKPTIVYKDDENPDCDRCGAPLEVLDEEPDEED